MADENNAPVPQRSQADEGRSGRGPQREPGGFRIRLSDNEMRAVRAVQDAFGLRSPVAALGFSVRTLGQMLEQGQLDELVAQHRAQAGGAGGGRRSDGPRGEGGGRSGGARRPWGEERPERGARRIDPFARPRKPEPSPETMLDGELTEAGHGAVNAAPAAEAPSAPATETPSETPSEAPAEAPLEPVD